MCLLTRADTPCATQEPDECWFSSQSTTWAPIEKPSHAFLLLGLVSNTNFCFPQIITMDLHDPQLVYSLAQTHALPSRSLRCDALRCDSTRVPDECLVP